MTPKRIDLLLPSFQPMDGIGTHAMNIQQKLIARGFQSEIFAEHTNRHSFINSSDKLSAFDHHENILIYQFSTGSSLAAKLVGYRGMRVCDYQNITPGFYFKELQDQHTRAFCDWGQQQRGLVQASSDYLWCHSKFSLADFAAFDPKRVSLIPIFRNYRGLVDGKHNEQLLDTLVSKSISYMLFVGRIVPNKAQHDLFLLLRHAQRYLDPKMKLILVGRPLPGYYKTLQRWALELGLRVINWTDLSADKTGDIIVAQGVTDEELSAFYRGARVFVCLSDHEGFCVPLIEAMSFGLPVICHPSSGVSETAGSGATLVDKTQIIELIETLAQHYFPGPARDAACSAALQRAEDFSPENLDKIFDLCLQNTLTYYRSVHQPLLAKKSEYPYHSHTVQVQQTYSKTR